MEHSPSRLEMTAFHNAEKNILIVEDVDDLRTLLQRKLSRRGYTVTTAANGGEALRLLEHEGLRPDLIITDVIMPTMNGKELVERIRQHHPHVEVIYMSGYADETIMPDGILNTDIPFIQKPFGSDDLERTIQEVLRHSPATITTRVT